MRIRSSEIRLSGRKVFDRVFAGKRLATPDLVFYFSPNGSAAGRAGMVVGKKAYAGAAARNLLKRRLRELFRLNLGSLKGFDVVIVAKTGRKLPEFAPLSRQMEKLAEAVTGRSGPKGPLVERNGSQ